MSDFYSKIEQNISIMNQLAGFDVVIICCSSSKQAQYWQIRLEQCRGSVVPREAVVLAVEEDWPGGAGNALGTLYAFSKARALALETISLDIMRELSDGKISVALYHTAGKGTRLAPLPGSENNNKPGVKLPTTITIAGRQMPITILEAVIKQTGCYAKSRMGRLSVFWGDQVFIPSAPADYTVGYHVDILCSLGPMLSEAEWREKGMDKYGLIALSKSGKGAAQVEKVDHATAVELLKDLGEIESVGASLGSFSLSSQMLTALLAGFSSELASKTGKFDSDPHLWMPMTLEKSAYLHLMRQKGIPEEQASAHFDRIGKIMAAFYRDNAASPLQLFGPVNVGEGVLWWDYGQLKLYQKNTLMLTERSKDADMMRLFLGLPAGVGCVKDTSVVNTKVDDTSSVSSCQLGSDRCNEGFVKNSVLCNVRCKYIEAEGCVLINVTAERIIARPGSIVYNSVGDEVNSPGNCLTASDNEVIVGVFDESANQMVIRSNVDTIDGGKKWDEKVFDNSKTFGEVYSINTSACPATQQEVILQTLDQAWSSLTAP